MEVVIHKQIDALKEIVPEYNELKSGFSEITVFHEVQSLFHWWDHYKTTIKNISPYIVEVKDENETVGIIPLYASEKEFANIKFRVLRPIGFIKAIYLIPILSKKYPPDDILKKAIEKIYDKKKDWDCIHWGDLPEKSNLDIFLENQLHRKKRKQINKKITSRSSRILLHKDIENVNKRISKSFLKEIKKKERKLRQKGDLYYNVVTDEENIEPIMENLFMFHQKRWEKTETPSTFESKIERDFMLKTVKNLYKNNLLHLSYLSQNGEIVAIEFGVMDQNTRYMIIGTTNPKFKKYSVGHIMVYKMIEEACAKGYEEMDFLRGDESYKQRFGPVNTVNLDYFIFNNSLKSTLFKRIHNSYYSKQFSQTSKITQIFTKLFIRGFVYIIGTNDYIKQRTLALRQ